MQSLRVSLVGRIPDIYRLVCQLKGNMPTVLAYRIIPGHDVPYLHQVFLVIVTHLQVGRTHPRWAHHDILPVLQRLLCKRHIQPLHVVPQPLRVEMPDVSLPANTLRLILRTGIHIVPVVRPNRIKVQAEYITIGNLEGREHLLEEILAPLHPGIIVAPTPSATVEPRIRRVHHTMQHNTLTLGIHQPPTLDMYRRQRLHTPCHNRHAGRQAQQYQSKTYFHNHYYSPNTKLRKFIGTVFVTWTF